jgi:hypothetical protein
LTIINGGYGGKIVPLFLLSRMKIFNKLYEKTGRFLAKIRNFVKNAKNFQKGYLQTRNYMVNYGRNKIGG